MPRGLKKIGLGLVAVGLSIVLLLTSAIPICEAGANEKVVKISVPCHLTGPMATLGVPFYSGLFDHVKHFNEQGGIDGIQIKCLWEDARWNIPRMIQLSKKFLSEGAVVEINIGTMPMVAAPSRYINHMPVVNADMIPPGINPKPPWFFTSVPSWDDGLAMSIKWAQIYWAEKHPQEKRPVRIGVMSPESPPVIDAIEHLPQVASWMGFEFVGAERVPLTGVIDTTVEWLRLAGKKPDFVIVGGYGGTITVEIKDYARLEMREKGIEFIGTLYSIDENIVEMAGVHDIEECFTTRGYPPACETDIPGIARIVELAREYRGWAAEDVSSYYVGAYILFRITTEGIRLAIGKVGYENLTPRAVRDGLASVKDLDIEGIIPPVSMSDDKPYFLKYVRTYQVQQGKQVPIGDWYEVPIISERFEEGHS